MRLIPRAAAAPGDVLRPEARPLGHQVKNHGWQHFAKDVLRMGRSVEPDNSTGIAYENSEQVRDDVA